MLATYTWNLLIYNLFTAISGLLLDGDQMVRINLPIMLISVGIYLLAFYSNYFKFNVAGGNGSDVDRDLKKKGIVGIAVRLSVSVLFGILHVSIAIGLSCYFLLLATGYAKEIVKRSASMQRLKIVADISYLAVPLLLAGLLFAIGGEFAYIGMISILAAVLLHVHWGRHHVKIPAKAYFERYEWNLGRRIPSTVQYALFTAMVLFLAVPLLGLAIANWGFVGSGYVLLVDVFDPVKMFAVNLPIIVASRLVFLKARARHFHVQGDQGLGSESSADLDDRTYKIHKIANNFTIIAAGTLVIDVALAVGTYSLLISILYLVRSAGRDTSSARMKLIIVSLLGAAIPLAFLAAASVYPLAFILATGLASIGAAFLLAILKGNSIVGLTRAKLVQQVKPRWRTITAALQIAVLVYGFGMPIMFLSGNLGGGPAVEHYMLRMDSDGIRLATDVYFSQAVGRQPAPVILVRTPYGKNETGLLYASLYTAQGYHVVVQDFRGTFESEGGSDFLIFTKDITDAPETIAWIRAQPWCNGKVGSVGASALCITQYLYAGMGPEGLLAQSFWFGTPDLIEDAILEGAFHKGLVEYWLEGVAHDNWRKQMTIIFETMANLSKLEDLPARSVTLSKPPNTYDKVTTRGIHVGGFYDHFLRGTIRGYTKFDDNGTTRARGHQKMVIGPWTHVAILGGKQGELTYPASSNGLGLIMDWETEIFDEAFLDKPANWGGNRVAYYLMGDVDDPSAGANYWKFAPDWPINNTYETWYLGVDNATGNKKLALDGVGLRNDVNLSYLYDPRDPIATRGGNNEPSYTEKGAGPFDQRPVETVDDGFTTLRDDLLLFQSDVIQDPITFEGDLNAKLHISSNCTDTDFMVKLCDVYPDGRRMLIIDSALTTRYRVNKSSENFLTPGQEYVIGVDLIATAYKFNTGHRIGITIQSSNYDRYIINPNTGGPITDHYAVGFVANNTVITGPGESCIYFPKIT